MILNFDTRSGYINNFQNKLIKKIRRAIFKILNILMFGSLSKTTGYAALFIVNHDQKMKSITILAHPSDIYYENIKSF